MEYKELGYDIKVKTPEGCDAWNISVSVESVTTDDKEGNVFYVSMISWYVFDIHFGTDIHHALSELHITAADLEDLLDQIKKYLKNRYPLE